MGAGPGCSSSGADVFVASYQADRCCWTVRNEAGLVWCPVGRHWVLALVQGHGSGLEGSLLLAPGSYLGLASAPKPGNCCPSVLSIFWSCLLVLSPGPVSWSCLLVPSPGPVSWFCLLVLSPDSVSWFCLLVLSRWIVVLLFSLSCSPPATWRRRCPTVP